MKRTRRCVWFRQLELVVEFPGNYKGLSLHILVVSFLPSIHDIVPCRADRSRTT